MTEWSLIHDGVKVSVYDCECVTLQEVTEALGVKLVTKVPMYKKKLGSIECTANLFSCDHMFSFSPLDSEAL